MRCTPSTKHGDVLARFAAAAAPVTQRQAVQANLRALLAAALQTTGPLPHALCVCAGHEEGGVRAPGRADARPSDC